MSLVSTVLTNPFVEGLVRILGLSLLAFTVTTVVTFVFRVRVRQQFPEGATLIVGLGVVAIYLNSRSALIQFISNTGDPVTAEEAILNVSAFVVAGLVSYAGRYVGDRAGASERVRWRNTAPDFSPLVRATGRFITVTLPETVEDIDGYDAVDAETKKIVSGKTMDFPRGLTIEELESQITARLKEEHDIGYVDADLDADGVVQYLAIGQRAAGLGQTLPQKSAAVAVRADPPYSATAGDTVQVWQTNDDDVETRLGAAELRGSVGTFATLAMDATSATEIDPTEEYRLMTLSADSNPEREFAAMLRREDETMSTVEITADSPLIGCSIGALDVTVIAVRSNDGELETIPQREHTIQPGDLLFSIGRPEALRKLESEIGARITPVEDVLKDTDQLETSTVDNKPS
ncbi:TrkA C-terminal domain-containing protein [Natrinema sp. DC36]|uniref:cation:proton antiporter regulatory subunit n=1 Tax=Natrinema sp. DC36 TaxID=2878680 RepID=UPI001CEFBC62|nr:TrkA C-terminal domain-containing protein [Natrinema sp. DC36]